MLSLVVHPPWIVDTVSPLLTSVQLSHLLSLKQQQASVIQAWQSIKQGEEGVKQGRSIMVFTTMTIIFVSTYPRELTLPPPVGTPLTLL